MMDQYNMDNFEDVDDETLDKLGLGTLDEEMLPAQTCDGEHNNLSEEMLEIVPRTTDVHEGNNNEVELNEEEIILWSSKFPKPKTRLEMNSDNLNEK